MTSSLRKNSFDSLRQKIIASAGIKKKENDQALLNQIRSIKSFTESNCGRKFNNLRDVDVFTVEIYRKYTQAVACLIMFLIGAPLGAIIKKGGFGVPVLISILFFILYYVLSITGEKWSKENIVDVPVGMWATNFLLFWIGLFFLSKARSDSTLLESNYFTIFFDFIGRKFRRPSVKQN